MDASGLSAVKVTLCVDALAPQPGGIGRYTWELCKGLSMRDEVDSLHYFGRGRLIAEPRVLLEGKKLPRRRRIMRPFRSWQARQMLRSSLVHGPNYFLPASADGGIITVHDLSVFRYPETHPPERVRAFERQFNHSMQRAAHIITDTETIRREVIEAFSVSPDTITAISLGVDPRFTPHGKGELGNLRSLGMVPGGYGLCVSTLEPRKKIAELIRAWEKLPGNLRSRFPLALAGGSGWENHVLHHEIEKGVRQGWLRHLGFVDESLINELYAGAALFIYPSIYEGFGLPPIEAMASGVPVIVADTSCLPEVCGGAARYVDPDDVETFAHVIEDSLTNSDWRRLAVTEGLKRARKFNWNQCIDQTITVYRKVNTTS
jgi:alpha-1,3-rhamnosyl/mannosyltransferase